MFDAPLGEGRPLWVNRPQPTEDAPQPVPGWPGWSWWRGGHGWPNAKRGDGPRVQARNWTQLLATIRKREGFGVDDQVAELERLFPGTGWVFGTVWTSVNSGPDAKSLTARRGGRRLTALTVPAMAEQIRREETRE